MKNKNKLIIKTTKETTQCISITKYLSQKYKGKWKYECKGTWRCDDNVRTVRRTGYLCDDEVCNNDSQFFLYYNDDRTPEPVYFF